jgi:predicted Zn finger-like uncharacterized protein
VNAILAYYERKYKLNKVIITCPKCKTKYEIDANIIPKEGREFKCAVCQNTWMEKLELNKNNKKAKPEQPNKKIKETYKKKNSFLKRLLRSIFSKKVLYLLLIIGIPISAALTYSYSTDKSNKSPWERLKLITLKINEALTKEAYPVKVEYQPPKVEFKNNQKIITINGRIINASQKTYEVKPIIIEFLDDNKTLIREEKRLLKYEKIAPDKVLPFTIKTKVNSPNAKNLKIEFENE